MLTTLLLTVLLYAPTPEAEPPAKKELFAQEKWYQDQKGKEEEFVGVLRREDRGGKVGFGRFNPYRLLTTVEKNVREEREVSGQKVVVVVPVQEQILREVYVGGKPDLLAPYVGKKIKLIGKAVDMEVEGRQHKEIWPARLEVVAADKKEGRAEGGKEMKVLATGRWTYASADPEGPKNPQQHVIRNAEELAKVSGQKDADKVKEQLTKLLKVDDIDWKKQMLVVVTAGVKPTGGFSVEIQGAQVRDKAATVAWKLSTPKGIVTQAFTHPGQVALVARHEGKVTFMQTAEKRNIKADPRESPARPAPDR